MLICKKTSIQTPFVLSPLRTLCASVRRSLTGRITEPPYRLMMSTGFVPVRGGAHVVSVQFADDSVRQVLQLALPTLACLKETVQSPAAADTPLIPAFAQINRYTDQFVHQDIRIIAQLAEAEDVTEVEDYLSYLIQQSSFSNKLCLHISSKKATNSQAVAISTTRPERTGPSQNYDGFLSYRFVRACGPSVY
ncbi:hypothetical protein HDU84_005282 [Entophlyctis sp. JEL0112]|nr:hypothetical protein HDU84_005282 [Entophlyctis sp. JEL0112]